MSLPVGGSCVQRPGGMRYQALLASAGPSAQGTSCPICVSPTHRDQVEQEEEEVAQVGGAAAVVNVPALQPQWADSVLVDRLDITMVTKPQGTQENRDRCC